MLQFGVSLTDDTMSVNYDCNTFIIQATALLIIMSIVLLEPTETSTEKGNQNKILKKMKETAMVLNFFTFIKLILH
jgi:hypothetical protein